MPWGDWQFWIVTVAALGAAAWLLRGWLPSVRSAKRTQRRATLTIGGKPVDRSKPEQTR